MADPTNWRDRAACRSTDPLVFEGDDLTQARQLCAACPVRTACLDETLRLRDVHGFRAGMTGDERKKLLPPNRRPWKRVPADEVYRLNDLGWPMRVIAHELDMHVDSVRRVLKKQREAA